METFGYILIGAVSSICIFYIGWMFGCMFVEGQRKERDDLRYDYYGERDFYNNYYGSKTKAKAKAKKISKK
jgi:hypothetical protein